MAKSLAPQDIPQLGNLLSQSGLLAPEALEQAQQLAGDASTVPDAVQRWIVAGFLSPWQAAQLAAGQFVLKLGSYHLVQEAKAWEFGRAFHARHQQTRQDVTLKLLANRWLQHEETWRETSAQLRIAQTLKSPHLSPFTSVSRAAQRTFLISELEPADDIAQLLQQYGPPSVDQAARIIREATLGLVTLHQANLAHGALSPSRVTITPNGMARLIDIGLSPLTPGLFEFLRASLATTTDPAARRLLDPRFALPEHGPGEITPARWDTVVLARIGLLLLDESTRPAPSNEEPPTWWLRTGAEPSPSRERLLALLTEASQTSDPAWSADKLLEALNNQHKPVPPRAPVAKTSPVSPPTSPSKGTTDHGPKVSARISKPSRTSVSPPSRAEPDKPTPSIMIDTQRRRRRTLAGDDERTAALRRLHRRRAAWLYLSLGMTVVVLLMMTAITFWPADGIRWWPPSLANRQQNEEGLVEEGGEEGDAAAKEGSEFPDSDALSFPTPEMFADARPEPLSPQTPDGVSSDTEQPDAADSPEVEPALTAAATSPRPSMPDDATPDNAGDEGSPAPVAMATTATEEVQDPPPASPESEPEPASPSPTTPPQFLAQLPPRIAIPEPGEATRESPAALFPLKLEPNHAIEVSLLGGEHILKGNPTLRLEHADGGTAERKWDVLLVDRTGPPTPVAEFSLDQDQLFFHWQPASQDRTEAAQLMNCALNITLGTETHRMFLRHPVEAPAPTMDFARGISSIRWDIPHAPETTQCRLELIGLEGPFPATRQFPGESLSLSPTKQDYWILVGQEPEEQGLTFHVETQARRQIELNITSVLFAGDAPPPPQLARSRDARITTANRRRWLATAQGRVQQVGQQLAALNAIDPNSAGARTSQQELARQKNLVQLDLEAARRDAARIETLEKWASSMHDVGKLHFRVYFEFAGNQIDLLRTSRLPEED